MFAKREKRQRFSFYVRIHPLGNREYTGQMSKDEPDFNFMETKLRKGKVTVPFNRISTQPWHVKGTNMPMTEKKPTECGAWST